MMKNEVKKNASYVLLVINVLVVILISSNLRSPIVAVAPVLGEVRDALHLDNFQVSLLTSIPLFMFAACSVLVSRFSNKFGISKLLMYSLIILSFGLFLRISGSLWLLFLGSLFIGLGICIGNVVTPGYVKNNFPKQIGLMTGIFAVSMNLTAALASGFSVKIGEWTGFGWKGSLGIWLVIAALGFIVLSLEFIFNKRNPDQPKTALSTSDFNMFRSAQAWNISIFMGLQSLFYYCLVAWLPSFLADFHMQGESSGWVFFVIQITMIPVTFCCPIIASKMKDQRAMILFICTLMFGSTMMFVFLKSQWIYVNAVIIGISNGLSFSLSILFFSTRTKSSINAVKISGMAQSVGYLIAAFGPPLFGKMHDWDISWNSSFYLLSSAVLLMLNFEEFKNCGLRRSLDFLSGKWKPLILQNLFEEDQVRFVELWRNMPRVSKKVLAEQLKQLEKDLIIERTEVYNFPPEVYYKLTEKGQKLGPILSELHSWGDGLR